MVPFSDNLKTVMDSLPSVYSPFQHVPSRTKSTSDVRRSASPAVVSAPRRYMVHRKRICLPIFYVDRIIVVTQFYIVIYSR